MKTITIVAATALAAMLAGCAGAKFGEPTPMPRGGHYGAKWAGTTKRPVAHKGVDYAQAKGAPVLAAADGIVTKATHSPTPKKGWRRWDCRNEVRIDHTGIADGFATRYCHMGPVHVYYGDAVRRGQVIGNIGLCGPRSRPCGYHLHFEVTRPKEFARYDPQTKVAGCYGREAVTPTRERPLTYPVKC